MKYNLKLTGTITSLSPIAVVPPGAEEISVGAQKYKKVANTILYEDGIRHHRPIIPGSTLRGGLRRAALKAIIAASGEPVSLGTWHLNAVGGVKGAESESGFDVVGREAIRAKNPILSLFGAGSPWINSRASIGNAVPQHGVETVIVGGVRADDGRRDNTFFQNLDENATDERLALTGENAARTSAKKSIAALRSDLRKAKKDKNEEEIARLDAELKKLGDDEKTSKAMATNPVSMPLTHEAIPAGVVFNHEMKLIAVTKEEIGLFFIALNGLWKRNPAIGQHANLGYGMTDFTYNLTIENADEFDPFKVGEADAVNGGTITGSPHDGLVDVPDFVKQAIEDFRKAFNSGAYDFKAMAQKEKPVSDETDEEEAA
jgi:CRISPR type IV-associated protein Csf2